MVIDEPMLIAVGQSRLAAAGLAVGPDVAIPSVLGPRRLGHGRVSSRDRG